MEVRASVRYESISPQKLRLVIDQVRGMPVQQALVILQFVPKKGAGIVTKTLQSAIANAENNFELDRESLFIKSIVADGGPTQKRFKAGARGRYKPRIKRTSHLTIILSDDTAQGGN
jgi:large subunit ribosomal protein L22